MNDDKNKQMFLSLIYSFQMQTMMQLGKLANPMSGKIERELDGAQMTIDMLDMLKAKTVNNITDDEKKFLDQAIGDLKLNFIEEKEKDTLTENESNSKSVSETTVTTETSETTETIENTDTTEDSEDTEEKEDSKDK